MNCEVLVSTINQKNKNKIINDLRINDCVIINQLIDGKIKASEDENKSRQKFFNFQEKGLSKSRNNGIEKCSHDICIIADDDMYYTENYEETILNAYKRHKDADIIAFVVDNESRKVTRPKYKEGRIGFIRSMKICSVHLSFKQRTIKDHRIVFDEEFGTGSTYPWGEENIFLFDCLRKKLKMYYVPEKIATLKNTGTSTWDRTVNHNRFKNQGAVFYRMTHRMYLPLIIQYVIRKHNLYRKKMSPITVFKLMLNGAKEYKKGHKNG